MQNIAKGNKLSTQTTQKDINELAEEEIKVLSDATDKADKE